MEKFDDKYEIINLIGQGSYAKVYKAIDRRTGDLCAIKKMPDTSELNNLINEIGIMSDCECKNIVRFLASDCSNREVSIVMEYCCGGSVKDVMRQLGRTMTQGQIIVILRDVLNGLDYLHTKNKIHRDVKAANILLDEEGTAKLADFGVSERSDTSEKKKSIIGTVLWLPPEVINGDPAYGSVIDIWSLGITIIEMGDGQPPYSDLAQEVALKEIANLENPAPTFQDTTKWSPDLIDFLAQCLNQDSSKRKCAKELLDHEIFKNAPSNEVIRSLVTEICSTNFKSYELETNLHKRSKYFIKEGEILLRIYEERKIKGIRVHRMIESLNSVGREFKELQDNMTRREARINEIKSQSKSLMNEQLRLERERNELKSTLEVLNERKLTLRTNIDKIRVVQRRHETSELERQMKLRSLEGKSG